MDIQEELIYIEVYSILKLLGNQYISKIPKSLYNLIEENVTDINTLKYHSLKEIKKDNIEKKSIAIIALLHINYWCKSKEEKEELNEIFKNNFIKNEKEKREKYNPDNIFKKNDNRKNINNQENSLIEVKKNNFITKLLSKIKKIFK